MAIMGCAGLERGEIGAVIGLRESLAPDFLRGRNLRDVAVLLIGRAPLHQGRADARDALEIYHRRTLGAVEFLVIDDLLQKRRATAAIFFWPVDTHPAAVLELAMPCAAAFDLFLGVR